MRQPVERHLFARLCSLLRKAGGVGKILEDASGSHARRDCQNTGRTVAAAGVGLHQTALSGQACTHQHRAYSGAESSNRQVI